MDYSREFTDQISVRLPPHWVEILKEDARENEVTVADLVRAALNDVYCMYERGHKRIVQTRDQATLPYLHLGVDADGAAYLEYHDPLAEGAQQPPTIPV